MSLIAHFWTNCIASVHTKQETKVKMIFNRHFLSVSSSETTSILRSKVLLLHSVSSNTVVLRISALMSVSND